MVDQDRDQFLTCVHQERLESELQEADCSLGREELVEAPSSSGREELLVRLREARQTIKKVYEVREA